MPNIRGKSLKSVKKSISIAGLWHHYGQTCRNRRFPGPSNRSRERESSQSSRGWYSAKVSKVHPLSEKEVMPPDAAFERITQKFVMHLVGDAVGKGVVDRQGCIVGDGEEILHIGIEIHAKGVINSHHAFGDGTTQISGGGFKVGWPSMAGRVSRPTRPGGLSAQIPWQRSIPWLKIWDEPA